MEEKEQKDSSMSGSLDINSEPDSPNLNENVNVAPPPVQPPPTEPEPQPLQSLNVGAAVGGSGDVVKKKRGRPKKYDEYGNLRVPAPVNRIASPTSPVGFSISPASGFYTIRGHGRGGGQPLGSGNWHTLGSLGEVFAESAGGNFTPHMVNVYAGEDIATKILSLFQTGPREICVLSANGAVSNVTIRQPGSSGGVVRYQGRFEILSLSGSFEVLESGLKRTGAVSASLAGPDGSVIGGSIAGTLIAASPIQCVVGSFKPNAYKMHSRNLQHEARRVSLVQGNPDVAATRPNLQASDGSNASHILQSQFQMQNHVETNNSTIKDDPYSADLNVSEEPAKENPSPDINMDAPDE